MKKSILKLLVLVLCAAMVLSFVACDGGKKKNEESTKKPAESQSETVGGSETEPVTQPGGDETQPGGDETQPGGDETQPGGDETQPGGDETQPGGDETQPGGDETQPGGDETQPGGDETQPGGDESNTDPVGPTCDGNHAIKNRGDQGHYVDACEICGTERGNVEAHTYEDKEGKPTCTVCGYVASCQGLHAWQKDAEGHWSESCYICGAAAVEKAEHTMDRVDGKYACTVCGFEETCDGVHDLISDGEAGHHDAACVICGTEAGATVAHEFAMVEGKPVCACGYEAACGGDHNWQSDAEGHWADACDVCGAAALEKTAHDEFAEIEVAGAYAYGCPTCGYAAYTKIFTEGVKQFLSSSYIANGAKVYYAVGGHDFAVDGNMPYTAFVGNDATAQAIWVRAHEDMIWTQKASESEQNDRFDIGQATYLVIKLRTNNNEQHMAVSFSTTGKSSPTAVATEEKTSGSITIAAGETYNTEAGYCSFLMPVASAENDTWTTFVIDLAKVCPEQLVADETTGTYIVDTLYFHWEGFKAENEIDVAYMAFVEGDWSAVAAGVEEETVVSVTASGVGAVVDAETAACIGAHNYAVTVVDGYYKSVCACGAVKDSYGVKADGPDAFWGAESLYGWVGFTGNANKEVLYEEDGTGFVRFSNTTVNADKWSAFQLSNNNSTTTGQYMVMKYRIGENGLGQTSLLMYINSKGSQAAGNGWWTGGVTIKASEDGQWHYVVIDLANRVAAGGFNASEDGSYSVNYFSVRYFTGYQTLAQADDYMDVSYVAFCDSLDDIKNIIDVETYEWSAEATTNSIRNTADNSCAQHAVAEVVDGTTHTIKCTLCNEVIRTFEVPASINWYATLSSMNKYQHNIEKMLYDEEEGVLFNRYTGTGGNHLNLTGGGGAGAATGGTFTTGKYVVIKYRVSVTGGTGTAGFNVGTGASSGSSLGTQDIAAVEQGVWRVAIIDASGAAKWISDGSAQTIYMMITTGGSGAYVFDVAYVAVVDSIDEMKLLLQEGETYFDYGTNWAGAPTEYNQDGTKAPCKEGRCAMPAAATITDGENGAKIYTYACQICGSVISEKVVPAGVIYMAPEIIKTTTNATVVNPNAENANSPEVYAEKNDLHPQTQFAMTGAAYTYDAANALAYFGFKGTAASHKTVQFIWNRAYEDYTSNAPGYGRYTLDMGQSRFLVVKVRTNLAETSDGSEFSISISTKGQVGGSIKLPVQETQGDWVTYVIDLETLLPEKWVKDAETGTYIMDTFYMNFYNCLTENSVDIAYIAFVDGDWSNVDAFVDEETVINVTTATDRTYDVCYADGTLPGSTADDPINVVFDEWGMATVTVPAKTTFYYSTWMLSGEMSLSANGEPIEFVAGAPRRTPSTFSITNDGEEAMEYFLYATYPEGHMENPSTLWDGETYVEIPAGSQGYFFNYTAEGTGKLTLTFASEGVYTYVINNITAGIYGDMQLSTADNFVNSVVIDINVGDEYQIIVCTYDANDPWNAPEGTITVTSVTELPLGSEWNPVIIADEEVKVTIPAGATFHFTSRAGGATLFVNGEDKGVIEAGMWAPYTFTITNESEADAEYVIIAVFPAGTQMNPEELVIGENTAEIAEGAQQPYFYTWTAPAAGKFTITISSTTGWFYVVNNTTSGQYGDMQWSDSDPVVATLTVDVAEGDVLDIQVNTYDPANQWSAPAGAVVVTAAFEEAAEETFPQENVAYKMQMVKTDNVPLYFTGATESASVTYRLATTTDIAQAADIYVEKVEGVDGAYRLYFMNGETKTYIRVFERTDGNPGYGKGSLEFVTTAPAEYYTYDETAQTLVYTADDGENAYYMGTYGTYTTFSVSNTSYITGNNAGNVDSTQFPARLVVAE